MNRLLTVFLLALATTVQADELKIDETDELIIVEYVGTPSAIAELAGNESEDELRLKHTLADEKQQQIETYSDEVRRVRGNLQADEAPPVKQQSQRLAMKRQMKELKKLRLSAQSSPTPE
jgi:hypothetical protein